LLDIPKTGGKTSGRANKKTCGKTCGQKTKWGSSSSEISQAVKGQTINPVALKIDGV